MLRNYKFAIDIDGTITNEVAYCIGINREEVINSILSCTPKKGIEEVFSKDLNITLITGRLSEYREETEQWLHDNEIRYNQLIMIPNKYYKNGFDESLFLNFKLTKCIRNRIQFALDDNEKVIKILRSHNIKAQLVKENILESFDNLILGE